MMIIPDLMFGPRIFRRPFLYAIGGSRGNFAFATEPVKGQPAMTLKFQVADMTIHRIVEIELPFMPVLEMLPALTPELLAENRHWMQPDALDQNDFVKLCVQSYVVETPHHTILIDTCFGNDKPRPRPEWNMKSDSVYLDALAAAGFSVGRHRLCHVHASSCRPYRLEYAAARRAVGADIPQCAICVRFAGARLLGGGVPQQRTPDLSRQRAARRRTRQGRARGRRLSARRPHAPASDARPYDRTLSLSASARRTTTRCFPATSCICRCRPAIRNSPSSGTTTRSRVRKNAPLVPGTLLRHQDLVLHGTLSLALSWPHRPLGRRISSARPSEPSSAMRQSCHETSPGRQTQDRPVGSRGTSAQRNNAKGRRASARTT